MSGKIHKNGKCASSNRTTVITSLQKSNSLMKTMNKELVLNIQKLKEDLHRSTTQNSSLKAELYDMIMERNSLMEKNMKLIEMLKSIHTDTSSIRKRIEDVLNPKEPERDQITTKQSAMICPMVSGHVIHNPKVELRRLNLRGNDAINLSPIVEEQFIEDVVVPRRLGHRLRLSRNISSIGNGAVSENSIYSVGIGAENERDGHLLYSERNNPVSDVSGIAASVPMESESVISDEVSQAVTNNDIDETEPAPSCSKSLVDGNRATENRRNSTESGRNSTTLLTINVMSPKNDHQSSSTPVNPAVFVNVFPRKRKFTPRRSSTNEFTVSGMTDNNEVQDTTHSRIIDFKQPIILLERHPLLPERSEYRIPSSPTVSTNEDSDGFEEKPNISEFENCYKRKTGSTSASGTRKVDNKDLSIKVSSNDSRIKRRSSRIKKPVIYKEN